MELILSASFVYENEPNCFGATGQTPQLRRHRFIRNVALFEQRGEKVLSFYYYNHNRAQTGS